MFRFSNMSINRKVTALILVICAAMLLLAGAVTIIAQFAMSRSFMVQNMHVLADILGRNSTASLNFHREEDAEELSAMLAALLADPQIVCARVFDESNIAFADYIRADGTTPPAKPPADGHRFVDGHLELSHPIMMDEKRIGTMFLRADLQRTYNQLALHAGIVGGVLLLGIVVTLVLSPRLRRPIAEPILALAEVAKRIAERKEYSTRAPNRGSDEVGVLTAAFNQMLDEIESRQGSLEQANKSMEIEIVERKRTEQALAQAKEAAEAANRAKDQFLAVLSHELRTPLTPVLLTVSLMETHDDFPEALRSDLETIRRHVELEARLIDDLLDVTRIAQGKLQLKSETADAHLLIRSALDICCLDRMRDIKVALQAERHYVRADPARLQQVFWNLLSNASKFTPAGMPIEVRTKNLADGTLQVQVIDSGVGIDPKVLPVIFNAFEQGDSSLTRHFGGLGLGLTITKALVDAHEGSIRVESQGRGTGATFTVELPTIRTPVARPVRRPPPASVRDESRNGLRVLVVEDHPGTLALMIKMLTGLGHNVQAASSVKEALELAATEEIDLLISDLGLPDGSGHDVIRALRATRPIKGIAVSGYGMSEDVRRSMEAGFANHLIKPIDLDKLQAAIQQAVA